jgi:hypothetical protein
MIRLLEDVDIIVELDISPHSSSGSDRLKPLIVDIVSLLLFGSTHWISLYCYDCRPKVALRVGSPLMRDRPWIPLLGDVKGVDFCRSLLSLALLG